MTAAFEQNLALAFEHDLVALIDAIMAKCNEAGVRSIGVLGHENLGESIKRIAVTNGGLERKIVEAHFLERIFTGILIRQADYQ